MRRRVALVGPVFPYRAGIAYCTTRLADELRTRCELLLVSFRRQFPQRFYPGKSDLDSTLEPLRPRDARFTLDIINPLTWIAEGVRLRRAAPDAVVFVWWIWVWALPYLTIIALLRRSTRIVLQCHNIGDKEPSRWKSALTNAVLRRAHVLLVHANSEAEEARRRIGSGVRVVSTFLPVHELGTGRVDRDAARRALEVDGPLALFFGHVRPFKGLDLALRALPLTGSGVTLLVAGEVWWDHEREYRELVASLGLEQRVRLEFRFIPDGEIALWFGAADVVLTPYRTEAQSGVAMTAFHFGRPVIATRVGGVPEIIEDGRNGLLVEPENVAQLAQALDRFFGTVDRGAMEREAEASAAKYSWSEYGSIVEREL